MATYQSNRSGKARARAQLGADFAGEKRRLVDKKAALIQEYNDLWSDALEAQREWEEEERKKKEKRDQDWGFNYETLWEVAQVAASVAVGFANPAAGFALYAALQEGEEGYHDYIEKGDLEGVYDKYAPQIKAMAKQLDDFDFDISDYQKKFQKLYDPLWEVAQEGKADKEAD